jgi:AraC-like DNA-binding protein
MITPTTEPQLCRLPDILLGGAAPPFDRVTVYDHRGHHAASRTMVAFTQNAIAVVIGGSKQLMDGQQVGQLGAGDVVLYAPGNVLSTSMTEDAKDYRSLILFFSDPMLRAFIAKHDIGAVGAASGAAFANLGSLPAIGRLAETMVEEMDAGRPPSPAVAALTLELALLLAVETRGPQVMSLFQRQSIGRAGLRLQKVMETHWHRNLALADLAFLCGMSLSTFKRAFEAHYGQSPGRWLQERRLRHASHLLLAERRRASEVFEMVGYANHSVFSHSFKKHFGVSPRDFQASAD